MIDIAERLRNYGDSHLKGCPAVITEAVAEIERLRELIQHPQLYTDGSVPVSAEWYGRILEEQTNQ